MYVGATSLIVELGLEAAARLLRDHCAEVDGVRSGRALLIYVAAHADQEAVLRLLLNRRAEAD